VTSGPFAYFTLRGTTSSCTEGERRVEPTNDQTELLPQGSGLPVGLSGAQNVPGYIRMIAQGASTTPTC